MDVILYHCGDCRELGFNTDIVPKQCPSCKRKMRIGEGGTYIKKMPLEEAVGLRLARRK